MAVSRFPHGADLARTFVRTIPEVFARTTAEPDAMGVVPIENLSTGNIGLTLDCLQLYGDAEITAELKLEIRFALVYKGEISCIERLYSHTEAYNQCSGYIFRNLKNHNLLEAPSNIAAYYRYTEDLKPETAAAIIPLPFYESENIAASYTGITDIQNERDNFTRFIIIRKSGNAEPDFTRYKTSIFVDMFQDRPSLLYHILEKFHRNACSPELFSTRALSAHWTSMTPGNTEMTVQCRTGWNDMKHGESVAFDGVCLSLTDFGTDFLKAELSPETLKKTLFGQRLNRRVNIERATAVGERLGGHFVQGHVECCGELAAIIPQGKYRELVFRFPQEIRHLMIEKGSVTVDGVSLTCFNITADTFKTALIPATLDKTNLGSLTPGSLCHLETDMLGRYLWNFYQTSHGKGD
ncbi:hypothetical protein CHS0354_027370 [Potamilus streckersoni]|uniref:Riboflavin synthase n=1 Tax=Potamilus streckersoni TaxID=2493646 RepID=A0AAE0W0S3_9BIVA|nr:hypothetical protein CHS0354_027370 [Potamilus streckersoni]